MKCSNCSFNNLPHSEFCQECGTPLKKQSANVPETQEKSLRQEIEKIDDVIFHPKKKGGFISNIIKFFLIIGGVGFIGLVGLIIFFSSLSSQEDTPTDTTINTIKTDLTTFPIWYLEIKDLDSEWIGQQLYLKGVLKNSYSKPAKLISLRVDFYKDKDQKELFDTRYVTLSGVAANGAYSFYEPVYINPTYKQFWYVVRVESANF